MNKLPLAGITVLDLSWVIAGPHAGRLLSDMGARVIKIETEKNIDMFRRDTMREGSVETAGNWALK